MKTKIWITTVIACITAAFIGGCKDENVEMVGVCPVVVSTTPANLAINVPLEQVIAVTFNAAMNPATIGPNAFDLSSPGASGGRQKSSVAGVLTYDAATFTMKFTPDQKLEANTTYSGKVHTSVKDMMGNALQVDYTWTFSTNASVSPTVTATSPTNNATGTLVNQVVNANFSMPMDASTIDGTTFTVTQGTNSIPGVVTFDAATAKASFTPNASLSANTVYTGTITTGAKNESGSPLLNNYVWTFTTGAIAAPTVTSTDPSNMATNVAANKVITAVFNEAMDAATITATSFTLKIGTTAVAGVVSYSGTTATFTPSANLLSGNTYTATITTAAKNISGISLASDKVWSFSTVASLGPVAVNLKSVARFGIIAGTGVSNNAGFSEIRNLDVGISPGVRSSITGFPPAIIVNGAMFASDDIAPPGVPAMLIQAKQDLTDAYLFAEGATSPAPATVAGDLGGQTLAPGIYKSTSTLLVQSGDLTLDAQGDPNAVWIFQIASDFTTVGGAGGNVILSGGAQAKNVFWQVGSSATIGDFTTFKGNVLALTSITMNSGAVAAGRMLARNGSVVMTNTNIIEKP
ncbi:MAG TPA: ice-binding family protein [Chryseosolibacter sp.]